MKVNFEFLRSLVGNETVSVRNPDWEFIRGQIELLRSGLGYLDFDWNTSLDSDFLSINTAVAHHVLLNCRLPDKPGWLPLPTDAGNGYVIYSEKKQLISEAKMFSSEMVDDVRGGESLEHNTVNDLDVVLGMLDNFAESGKYVDNKPYVWLDRPCEELSKRYDEHWL